MHKRAKDLISQLRLQPHPEGGYFREIFKSATKCSDWMRNQSVPR